MSILVQMLSKIALIELRFYIPFDTK